MTLGAYSNYRRRCYTASAQARATLDRREEPVMKLLLPRIALALLAALTLGGCAGMYFQDAAPPPASGPRDLAQWPYREYWTGFVFNGAKVGFARLSLAPAADEPGRYDIDSEAVIALRLLGLEKKFVLRARSGERGSHPGPLRLRLRHGWQPPAADRHRRRAHGARHGATARPA
jgi:hypothetical protein